MIGNNFSTKKSVKPKKNPFEIGFCHIQIFNFAIKGGASALSVTIFKFQLSMNEIFILALTANLDQGVQL